jgi:hypothetical protein
VATGAGAFATSYAILPRLGIYKRLSEYDGETLWQDLSAHLVLRCSGWCHGWPFRSAHKARKAVAKHT